MSDQTVLSVFCFEYRPLKPSGPMDGGFRVNLLSSNQLVITDFDTKRCVRRELYFNLPAEVCQGYLNLIGNARLWLSGMALTERPLVMEFGQSPRSEFTFCFCGYSALHIEDIVEIMAQCPFRSSRGHYSRLVYCLYEDICSLLAHYGVDLQLCDYRWNPQCIQPLPVNESRYYA